MAKSIWKTIRFIAGIFLVLFGIIGLLIPILQGWLLFLVGIYLINPSLATKLKDKMKLWWLKRKQRRISIEDEIM